MHTRDILVYNLRQAHVTRYKKNNNIAYSCRARRTEHVIVEQCEFPPLAHRAHNVLPSCSQSTLLTCSAGEGSYPESTTSHDLI